MGNWTKEQLDEMLKDVEYKLRDLTIQKGFIKHFIKELEE